MKIIPFQIRLVFALTAVLLSGHSRANTASSFDPVVRLQGSNSTDGGTGTLIGASLSGNDYSMVFLATDHTALRVGPLTTIGFGDESSPELDLNLASAVSTNTILYGANGTTDLSLIELTINLTTLSAASQNFLLSVTPLNVAMTPTAPFTFQAYTYGQDGGAFPGFGTQNTFTNQVESIAPFSGSYTTDSDGNPLYYTETLSEWEVQPPGPDTAQKGGSGSPMLVGGDVVGFQVNGSLVANMPNYGVAFNASDVDWIDANVSAYLVPEPSTSAMMLGGLSLLAFCARRKACLTN